MSGKDKGQSLLEAIIALGILSAIALFVFSFTMRMLREVQIANAEIKLSEALVRAKIFPKGNFKGVKWKREGEKLFMRLKNRKIFLRLGREKDEELRLYPR